MGRWTRLGLVALVVVGSWVGLGPPAGAQELPYAQPGTITLDRMDSSSRFGIQAGFVKLDAVPLSDGFFTRYDLHGQYVIPEKPAGIYGQISLAHVHDFTGDDATGVGNLDIGGFFM